MQTLAPPPFEFLLLPRVMDRVGLSKSEIYRRVADGTFPKPRREPGRKRGFWLSNEIFEVQIKMLKSAGEVIDIETETDDEFGDIL